jgi:hypothetical protein
LPLENTNTLLPALFGEELTRFRTGVKADPTPTQVFTVFPRGEVRVIVKGLVEAGRRRVNALGEAAKILGATSCPADLILSM